MPAEFGKLFKGCRALLESHRGYDPGALDLARACARRLNVPLHSSTTTRLLVELNRSLGHAALFSEVTKPLPENQRQAILQKYYVPYRTRLETEVGNAVSRGQRVIHLSIHTFTPQLGGDVRRADVGLLYDPARRGEAAFCGRIRNELARVRSEWIVRKNYPYRGTSDGFTTALRRTWDGSKYVGIEIEINQRWFFGDPRAWRKLTRDFAEALAACLAVDASA